jgi:hypothetical protein
MRVLIPFILFMTCCSPALVSDIYHDGENPCTPGQYYYDSAECSRFKEKYPKDYERYKMRIEWYEREGLKLITE